jgi:hypothetical protein
MSPALPPSPITRALREAGFAGLVAAGLAFPILVLGTEMNQSNRLVLEQRWSWMAMAAGLVFHGAVGHGQQRLAFIDQPEINLAAIEVHTADLNPYARTNGVANPGSLSS